MSLVFLDTETTGLDPRIHSIWEIGYVVEDAEEILHEVVLHSLENADPFALEIGNYSERAVMLSPKLAIEFESTFMKALEGNTVVGANPRFDMNMLAARWGVEPWHYRSLDIESYAMGALGYEKPQRLKTIREDLVSLGYDLPEPMHTAWSDVNTLREVFYVLRSMYSIPV
jgi:DNA polymerase III alpha subunit (gram-positive type)